MRWRKSTRDDTQTSLFGDVLTDAVRHTGGPSLTDQMQQLRDTFSPPFAFFVYEHAGGTATAKTAYVPSLAVHPRNGRIASRVGIGWNGELLTVMSADGHVDSWTPRAGGVLREFRGDPERTPRFVVRSPGSGQVAEIAAVTSQTCAFWLLFLDERRHQLADLPIAGFDEPRLIRLADAAGLQYRRYLLDVETSVIRLLLSSEYFPGKPAPLLGPRTPVEFGQWVNGHTQP